jgi:hypothetical protein
VEFLPAESLLSILPEATQADRLAAALRAGALKTGDPRSWQDFTAHLHALPKPWPLPLAREVLSALRRAAADGIPWPIRGPAEALVISLPPALLGQAVHGWPIDQEGVAGLVELITFRHDALAALSQP